MHRYMYAGESLLAMKFSLEIKKLKVKGKKMFKPKF